MLLWRGFSIRAFALIVVNSPLPLGRVKNKFSSVLDSMICVHHIENPSFSDETKQ